MCISALKVRSVTIAGLILLSAGVSPTEAQHLPIKTYTTADGLAQNQVNRIKRDSRGYMWFCTAEGLSRFDGYRFTSYTTDQGLPHLSVRDLLETRSGVYWVATGDGLCRFNPQSEMRNPQSKDPMFTVYRPGESPQARITRILLEDHAGTIWVGTEGGVYRLEEADGQVKFQFVDMGMPAGTYDYSAVVSMMEDRRGALWVGTRSSGLYRRLPDGGLNRLTVLDGLPSNRVNALLEDREGRLWAGTTAGLCLLMLEPDGTRPRVARVYTKKDFGLVSSWIFAMLQTSDGRVWLAIDVGLSEFTPAASGAEAKFKSYTTAHGLSYGDFSSLVEDSAGNLWIGGSGGAMKLARNGFITYTEAGGSRFNVSSIFETRSGELCFTAGGKTDKLFLIRYDEKGPAIIRPNFPKHITYFGWGFSQIAFQDHLGEWWIATGQGLCRFPKVSRIEQLARTRPRAVYTTKDGLIADDVWRIYEDSRGDIWVASFSLLPRTQSGLARWERATETFHRYTSIGAGAFCEDASGDVWIGRGRLTRYAAGRLTVFTTADGLPASNIHALHLDPAGRLWIPTAGGLTRVDTPTADRPSFVTYTTANGLSSNHVVCVTSDLQGRIYASTGRGLDRLDPATGQVRHYTRADGLAGDPTGVAFRDRHGALWFGAELGVSRLIPELDSTESPPPILINGLRIAGERQPLSELGETVVPEIRLGPNDNLVQIDFVGLSFATGEQLHYQYKLEGADADWSAPTDQRSITYGRLPSRSYRFLVRALTSDGAMSQSPAIVSFTILPPIWQRWWFLILGAMLIGLAAYALYRSRVARLVELERVRTRIAADLHDDIGASLSRVAILSEVVKHQVGDSARESVPMLTDIADSVRGLTDSMRDIVWAVDPRRDDLSSVVSRIRQFASDVLEAKGIKWEFRTPSQLEKIKLGPDQRRHIFLLFKEAITNVGRHSDCSRAWLSIDVAHNQFIGEVRDDGRGLVPADARQISGEDRRGHGLENITKRVSQSGGTVSIYSAPGAGTHLKLTIPLKKP